MLYHTGGLPDFTNHLCFYPEEKLGVCWLSNLQDGSSWRPPAPTVLRIALGEKDVPIYMQSPPSNWEKIAGTYGDETGQMTIKVVNGYLTLGDRLTLERLDDSRYRVHGPMSDGEELTFEYAADGSVTQFDLGTNYHRKYIPTAPKVDLGADLVANWSGEYYDASGFHHLHLRITSRTTANVSGPNGEYTPLRGFRAELGYVTGHSIIKIPREYARWGTNDYADIKIELKAVEGKLNGLLHGPNGASRLTLEKTV
jgi:hypothetical protein